MKHFNCNCRHIFGGKGLRHIFGGKGLSLELQGTDMDGVEWMAVASKTKCEK